MRNEESGLSGRQADMGISNLRNMKYEILTTDHNNHIEQYEGESRECRQAIDHTATFYGFMCVLFHYYVLSLSNKLC